MDKSEHNDCYISVSSNNENLGTAIIETASNANGRYDKGASVTVKATPSGSSDFEGWKVGQDIVSTDLSYTFTVTESVHIIAVFSTVEPVLAEPQASTEAQPVWYQIMNAHTASERQTVILLMMRILQENMLRFYEPNVRRISVTSFYGDWKRLREIKSE